MSFKGSIGNTNWKAEGNCDYCKLSDSVLTRPGGGICIGKIGWVVPDEVLVDTFVPLPGFPTCPPPDGKPISYGVGTKQYEEFEKKFNETSKKYYRGKFMLDVSRNIEPCPYDSTIVRTPVMNATIFSDEGVKKSNPEDEEVQISPNFVFDWTENTNQDAFPARDCEQANVSPVLVGMLEQKGVEHVEHREALVRIGRIHEQVLTSLILFGDSRTSIATLYDFLCTLSNTDLIHSYDVLNISQGFYSSYCDTTMYKVLSRINIPIVCSAGNSGKDNDDCGHWPSNFSASISNVIAIGATDPDGGILASSNFGVNTVTLGAQGYFENLGDNAEGTSFAAAFVSTAIARSALVNNLAKRDFLIFLETVRNNPQLPFRLAPNAQGKFFWSNICLMR